MFKKISLSVMLLAVIGAGIYALAYIPPNAENCDDCMQYWMGPQFSFSYEEALRRCDRYFPEPPCGNGGIDC